MQHVKINRFSLQAAFLSKAAFYIIYFIIFWASVCSNRTKISSQVLPGCFASSFSSICFNLNQRGCKNGARGGNTAPLLRMELASAHFHAVPFHLHSSPGILTVVVQQSETENDMLCAGWLLKGLCLRELKPKHPHPSQMTACIQIALVLKKKTIKAFRKVIMFVSVKLGIDDGVCTLEESLYCGYGSGVRRAWSPSVTVKPPPDLLLSHLPHTDWVLKLLC